MAGSNTAKHKSRFWAGLSEKLLSGYHSPSWSCPNCSSSHRPCHPCSSSRSAHYRPNCENRSTAIRCPIHRQVSCLTFCVISRSRAMWSILNYLRYLCLNSRQAVSKYGKLLSLDFYSGPVYQPNIFYHKKNSRVCKSRHG